MRKFEALIYRHLDGYPQGKHGVIQTLRPVLKAIAKQTGIDDGEYTAAWVLYSFMQNHVVQQKKYYTRRYRQAVRKDEKKDMRYFKKKMKTPDFLSYGVCGDRLIHGDIAYFYRVYANAGTIGSGCIEVWEPTSTKKTFDLKPMSKWNLIKTVKF